MNKTMTEPTFRPARAQDKARVVEMTAHTWSDGDYIAEVWDRWLDDPQGELTIAEMEGNIVAMAKLTVLGPDEVWLEGLRVDSNYRQHGIGKAMYHHQFELAQRLNAQTIRYATGHDNDASHKIALGNGFRHIASYVVELQAQADPSLSAPEVLIESDWQALQTALAQAVYVPRAGNLYEQNWKWYNLTEERLHTHLLDEQVVGIKQSKGRKQFEGRLAAWAVTAMSHWSNNVSLNCIEGDPQALVTLARAMRGYAAQIGKEGAEINALEDPQLLSLLEMAEYTTPKPFSMHILEKQLST